MLKKAFVLDDGWRPEPPRIVESGIPGVSQCSKCRLLFKGKHRCDVWERERRTAGLLA